MARRRLARNAAAAYKIRRSGTVAEMRFRRREKGAGPEAIQGVGPFSSFRRFMRLQRIADPEIRNSRRAWCPARRSVDPPP
jgi:hypothetical protein